MKLIKRPAAISKLVAKHLGEGFLKPQNVRLVSLPWKACRINLKEFDHLAGLEDLGRHALEEPPRAVIVEDRAYLFAEALTDLTRGGGLGGVSGVLWGPIRGSYITFRHLDMLKNQRAPLMQKIHGSDLTRYFLVLMAEVRRRRRCRVNGRVRAVASGRSTGRARRSSPSSASGVGGPA